MHAFDLTRLWGLYWEPSWTFAEFRGGVSPFLKGFHFLKEILISAVALTSVKVYLESQICLGFLTVGEMCLSNEASQQGHSHRCLA